MAVQCFLFAKILLDGCKKVNIFEMLLSWSLEQGISGFSQLIIRTFDRYYCIIGRRSAEGPTF